MCFEKALLNLPQDVLIIYQRSNFEICYVYMLINTHGFGAADQ